jgi:enoyl-CoA hydratase/carnithine racemase
MTRSVWQYLPAQGRRRFPRGADLLRFLPLTTRERLPEDEWNHAVLKAPGLRDIAMLHGFELHKPIIAAINGYCIAGGMELMLATDIELPSSTRRSL